jgi:hypothetical protein
VQRTLRVRAAVRAVTVVAAVGITVAACAPLQLGAAAIYNSRRITIAKLTAEVANLNAAYQADKAKTQISYPVSAMPRKVLGWLLQFAMFEQLAARRGIVITPHEAQAQLTAQAARSRSSGETLVEAAVINGLPPDLLPELGRWFAIQVLLENQLDNGVAPTTSAAGQALSTQFAHLQCLTAKSMNIKVNPQYGALDYAQFTVVPVASSLAASEPSPGTSPTPAPQLTPAC